MLSVISMPFPILSVKYFTTHNDIGYSVLHLKETKPIVLISAAIVKLAQKEQTSVSVVGN
jgi:hypothetical protein